MERTYKQSLRFHIKQLLSLAQSLGNDRILFLDVYKRQYLDYNTAEINDVDSMKESMISSDTDYENAIQFLMPISGVKRDNAITIISETGIDMSQSCSSKRICCWAGLALAAMNLVARRKLFGSHVLEFTSNLH